MSVHNGIDIAQWRAQLPLAASGAGPVAHPSKVALAGYASLPLSLPPSLRPTSARPAHAKPVVLASSASDDCESEDGVPGLSHSHGDSAHSDSDSTGLTSPSESGSARGELLHHRVEIVGPAPVVRLPAAPVDPAREEREAKKAEADRLVDSTLDLLNAIWRRPCPAPSAMAVDSDASSDGDEGGVSLRTFVNEILRRSRSSCATLRAARWYLERAAVLLPCEAAASREGSLACPRRTFLSALVLANKFLHDRVYSNRAWGKVSGLEVKEISLGETALASLLDWSLWVRDDLPPSPPASPAAYPAAPPLVPVRQQRSWQPKRPLGPGRNDQAFRTQLSGGAPLGLPTLVVVPPIEAVAGEERKRRFGASKSFAPASSSSVADESEERAIKRVRVALHDGAGGLVGAAADGGAHEEALVGEWERKMRELVVG